MSDHTTPDAERDRRRVAERLEAAGVSPRRLIDVRDGEKGTRTPGHQEAINWMDADDDGLSGNYGIHPGYGLIEFDVDDYDDEHDTEALDALPETFTVESPHTADDAPGHRYYAVDDDDDVKEVLEDVAGTPNPEPTWGEVKYEGKYVVGPGSQLDGCSKEWCDECAKPDGGYYRIAEDRPIATVSAEEVAEVLRADPEFADDDDGDDDQQAASEVFDLPPEDANADADGDESDEWPTEADVREALTYIDPDVGNDKWVRIGYALGSEFDDSTALDLYEEWSQGKLADEHTGSLWNDEAERRAPDIIDRADPGGPATIATVVGLAKDGGWNLSTCPSAEAERAERQEQATDGGTTTAASGAEMDTSADEGDGLPDPSEHGFARYNGGYGYWNQSDGDQPAEWIEWTNFEIEVESFLTLEDGSEEFELTIHPRHSEEYTVKVPPTAFNEKRAFKSEVACGRTTTFTGGETALAKIKQFVGTQAAPELQGVRHMGRHDDEIVLPAGTLTADGWDGEPSRRYIERSLGIERKVALSPENDTGGAEDDRHETVREVLELLPETRDPERFIPAIGWFYATPLRPIITEITGEFPVLSVTGGTGAGKTSTLETMWELLGVGGDPFSANDTTFTSMTTLSATDTLPVWFDEYKPSDIHPGRLDGFHDLVRKSTRGGVVSKGNADQTTTEYHLQAPVVVSGEQRFAGPAEQRRSILTTFREESTDPEGERAKAYARLTGGSYKLQSGEIEHYGGFDPTTHAHAYHRWLLTHSREEITEAWRSAEERVLTLLEDYGFSDVDSAGRTALQTIVFGVGLYRAFADSVDADDPIGEDDLERALTYVAKQQGNDGRRESHLDEFVRLLSLAAMDNELEEDRHYTRTRSQSTGEWEIRVNMSKSYPKVARYVQNHGLSDTTEWLDEGDYRERIDEQAGVEDSYITCYSQRSDPVGRAFGINIPSASEAIEAFDDGHFYGREEQGENGRYPSDRDPDEEHWRQEQ